LHNNDILHKSLAAGGAYDSCHELGHMLLHRHIGQEDIEDKAIREQIELEANMFAGAFLIPHD
jgi:Zn-dependent peptidase ImmA (M78 family)